MTTKLQEICFCAVRKSLDVDMEWLDTTSIRGFKESVKLQIERTNNNPCNIAWSQQNPVVRIVKIQLTQIED